MTVVSPPLPAIKEALLCWGRIVEILHYDPTSGNFIWKSGRRCDQQAGGLLQNGYITIQIEGVPYRAHRLAWIYVHRTWPTNEIDHIDGCRANNAISNLREATRSQNAFNRGQARGYSYHLRDKVYRAAITVNRRKIHLGDFHSPDDAARAYQVARVKYAGDFALPRQVSAA